MPEMLIEIANDCPPVVTEFGVDGAFMLGFLATLSAVGFYRCMEQTLDVVIIKLRKRKKNQNKQNENESEANVNE